MNLWKIFGLGVGISATIIMAYAMAHAFWYPAGAFYIYENNRLISGLEVLCGSVSIVVLINYLLSEISTSSK